MCNELEPKRCFHFKVAQFDFKFCNRNITVESCSFVCANYASLPHIKASFQIKSWYELNMYVVLIGAASSQTTYAPTVVIVFKFHLRLVAILRNVCQ